MSRFDTNLLLVKDSSLNFLEFLICKTDEPCSGAQGLFVKSGNILMSFTL